MTDELAVTQPASDSAPETNVTDAKPAEPPAPEITVNAQKRIDKLTWEKNEYRRQLDELRARPEAKTEPVAPVKPPTLEEHGFDDGKYQAALTDFLTEKARQTARDELRAEREKEATHAKQRTFQERMDAYAKSKPGFYEKVGREDLTFFDGPVLKAIQSSELGPEIAEYLAENEDTGRAIAQLDPFLVAMEIGQIQAQLKAAKAPPPAPPKQSSAPPPVPKIEATDSTRAISSADPESDKLNDTEWVKAENRRLANKRKAKS